MRRLILHAVALCVACGACQKPLPRLNAPPHGVAEHKSELRDTFAHMAYNGLLADMSVSDVHFMPHRPMLSTLGEERLRRLAGLMEMYGGMICFNTEVTDEGLLTQRTNVIIGFLAEHGVDTSAEVLTRDLPGGRGIDASQAILIRANEGTYKPKTNESDNSSAWIQLEPK